MNASETGGRRPRRQNIIRVLVAAGVSVLLAVVAIAGRAGSGAARGALGSATSTSATSNPSSPATTAPPPTTTTTAPAPDPSAGETVTAPPPPPAPPAPAPVTPAAPAPPEEPEPPAPRTLPAEVLQAALERWLAGQDEFGAVSVGVALIGPGDAIWTGEAYRPGAFPSARVDDQYGVLSITKTFTEALVLREAAAGRIDLDAPMPDLPGVKPAPEGVRITPRMLLAHSSGLVNYMSAVGYDPDRPITPPEIVSLALGSPLLSSPGTEAHYSNSNFHWLGLLLEHATGRTFGDLVAGLADELHLPRTYLDPSGRPGWIGYASGGIRSTIADLARWGSALFTPNRLLSSGQLEEYTTVRGLGVALGLWPVCPCSTGPSGELLPKALGQLVANGGVLYYPEHQMVVVVHLEPGSGEAGNAAIAIGAALEASL